MRAILTYHSIDASGSPISVDEAAFAKHVRFLTSGRVRVVSLAELEHRSAPLDAVAITFDDGLANFAQHAWPLLREHGLPVTLFVVTRRAGQDNAWGDVRHPGVPDFPLLGWDALAKLAEEGVELGGHSRTHPHLESLPDGELEAEIAGCALDIAERTGRRPTSFCYPFGTFDGRAVACAARSYLRSCTTELRALSIDDAPHRLPRLDAYYYREPGRLEAWGSAAFRRHLWVRGTARKVRALLQKTTHAARR
jgi:peptidoglycan/xylan/chitin deacetylase (PgdA/CDA1 family)